MADYKITIYQTAKQDLREIVSYLNTLSPEAAIKYYDLIIEKIGSLTEMPERCPLTRDPQLKIRGYRFLRAKNYTVFYVVKKDTVQIRRILYSRRQYEWLL